MQWGPVTRVRWRHKLIRHTTILGILTRHGRTLYGHTRQSVVVAPTTTIPVDGPSLGACALHQERSGHGTMQSVSMSEAARRLLIAQPVGELLRAARTERPTERSYARMHIFYWGAECTNF